MKVTRHDPFIKITRPCQMMTTVADSVNQVKPKTWTLTAMTLEHYTHFISLYNICFIACTIENKNYWNVCVCVCVFLYNSRKYWSILMWFMLFNCSKQREFYGQKKSQKYKIGLFMGETHHFGDEQTSERQWIWQGGDW